MNVAKLNPLPADRQAELRKAHAEMLRIAVQLVLTAVPAVKDQSLKACRRILLAEMSTLLQIPAGVLARSIVETAPAERRAELEKDLY